MPTILRFGGYRLFFYSLENHEPAHVHIEQTGKTAKYWLDPVTLAMNDGFRSHELTKLRALVVEHRDTLQEAWNARFGDPV